MTNYFFEDQREVNNSHFLTSSKARDHNTTRFLIHYWSPTCRREVNQHILALNITRVVFYP